MAIINKKGPTLLGFVDLCILIVSLFLTLVLRYHMWPSSDLVYSHIIPFSIIFAYSLVVFYISGLYGRGIFLVRTSLPIIVAKSQAINGLIAVALFYFVPSFTVTPKTNLFAYLLLSSALLVAWRLSTYSLFELRRKYPALVIGVGAEVNELINEMSVNAHIGLVCQKKIDPESSAQTLIESMNYNGPHFQYIVADINNTHIESLLPELYARFFPNMQIVDIHNLYEQIFNRIPLSCMNYAWIMTQVSSVSPKLYDFAKRATDIFFGMLICGVVAIVFPFVALAIKLEDRGSIFIRQERTGKNGQPIHFYKFRSMQRNEKGKWVNESDNKVTRVGSFIRKTRIDELPQGLAVLKGDMSLIGPRSDIAGLNDRLKQEIPYYSVRTIVKPGLTGWAQVNQNKPPQSIEETKIRLSYDLYYIKHRSVGLDLRIILKTLKTLLSREGM